MREETCTRTQTSELPTASWTSGWLFTVWFERLDVAKEGREKFMSVSLLISKSFETKISAEITKYMWTSEVYHIRKLTKSSEFE